MAPEAFGESKMMNGQMILWQVVAAYVFALVGGGISTSLRFEDWAARVGDCWKGKCEPSRVEPGRRP